MTQTGAVAAVRPVGPLPGAAVPSPGAARPPHGPGSAQPPRGPDRDATEPGSGRPGWLGSDAIRNARFKLRRQMRSRRQLRLGVLVMVCVLVLGILPVFFAIRTANHDPVFDTLDALAVPQWAATEVDDQVSGSSWCLVDCRLRERTARSQHGWEETAQEYERALIDQGWRPWQVSLCPGQPVEGRYSCWRRDELTLDLWVRPRTCRPDPVGVLPSEATGELPSAGPGADPGDGADAAGCTGSTVTLKVRNAIDDERIGPQPSMDPSFTGETPDPILTEDPLAPTPS